MKHPFKLYKNGKEITSYKDYDAIHDVLTEVIPNKKSWTNEEIDNKIAELDMEDQLSGMMWGWNDTEFRDKVYTFFSK